MEMVPIGVVTGGGTGVELTSVFKHIVYSAACSAGISIEFIECPHRFHTYAEIEGASLEACQQALELDLVELQQFYMRFSDLGGRVLFRSAVNAETLYRHRLLGGAVKILESQFGCRRLLLIRDQSQGFYAVEGCEYLEDSIEFRSSFSLAKFETIASFARQEAEKRLRSPYEVWGVYKHHLFSNRLSSWLRGACEDIRVMQPNHATDLLLNLNRSSKGDILILAGNEVGDILHEVLLLVFSMEGRNSQYSKNVYLAPAFRGLVEYQTVHGSADEIAGRNRVNPFATIRAAAALVEEELGQVGFQSSVEAALSGAVMRGEVTGDLGGHLGTQEVANSVLESLGLSINVNSGLCGANSWR